VKYLTVANFMTAVIAGTSPSVDNIFFGVLSTLFRIDCQSIWLCRKTHQQTELLSSVGHYSVLMTR